MVRCPYCGKKFKVAESVDMNILELLKEKPMRWSELLEKVSCAKRTLASHLKKLREEGKIWRKVVDEGEYPPSVYYLLVQGTMKPYDEVHGSLGPETYRIADYSTTGFEIRFTDEEEKKK